MFRRLPVDQRMDGSKDESALGGAMTGVIAISEGTWGKYQSKPVSGTSPRYLGPPVRESQTVDEPGHHHRYENVEDHLHRDARAVRSHYEPVGATAKAKTR